MNTLFQYSPHVLSKAKIDQLLLKIHNNIITFSSIKSRMFNNTLINFSAENGNVKVYYPEDAETCFTL